MVAAKVCRSVFAGRLARWYFFSRHPVFADEPSLIPRQMLLTLVPDPLRWSVGDPHADSSKTSLELSFRSGAPSDGPPSGICQHVFSRHREDVRNVPLTGTAASATGQIICTSAGYTLRCRGIPTAQASL